MAAAANAATIAAQALQIQQMQQQLNQLLVLPPGGAAAAAPNPAFDPAHNAAMLALQRKQAAVPPKEFKGVTSGNESHRWIQSMNLYFEEAGLDEDAERLRAAGRLFTGPAQSWWEAERMKGAADPTKISTWAELVAAMKKRYEPVDLSQWVRQQMLTLAAKGMRNVVAYSEQFSELNSQINDMNEPDRIFFYRNGLPEQIRNSLAGRAEVLLTLQSNIEAAIRAEANRGTPAASSFPSHQPNRGWRPAATANQVEGTPSLQENREEQYGDMLATILQAVQAGRFAPSNSNNQQRRRPLSARTPGLSGELAKARMDKGLCIKCGESGHHKWQCTNAADTTTQPK
jgi:hypothetical protein